MEPVEVSESSILRHSLSDTNSSQASALPFGKEEVYRLVVECSADLISLADIKGRFIYVSPSFERDLGYKKEELLGTDGFNLVHPDDVLLLRHAIKKAFLKNSSHTIFRVRHKLGYWLYYEWSGLVVIDNKKNRFIASTAHNITERIQLEKRKDEFISIASHELKTPLASLKGFTQILQTKLDKDVELSHYLQMIGSQLERLTMLIDDLMDISKIRAGKLVLQLEKFRLDELIKDIVEQVQQTTKDHQLTVDPMPEVNLLADQKRVAQVLTNLLSNAIKFSPRAKKVLVHLDKEKDEVVVSVQDFGIGIHKKNLDRIFEPFYQADNTIRKSFAGLGLGLHIASEIIKKHRGKLWAKSQQGQGSTFYFSLPCKK